MKTRTILPVITVAAVALGVLSTQADAFPRGGGACREAVHELCGEPGEQGFRECVRERKDELPGECREKMTRMREKWKERMAACRGDVESLCGEVEPGGGGIRECLREHRDELSDECRTAIRKHRHHGKHRRGHDDRGGAPE